MTLAVTADACRQCGKVHIVQNFLTQQLRLSVKLIRIVVRTKLRLL